LANKPVFFDATGRRAARFSTVGWVVAVLSTILFAGFAASLLIARPAGKLDLPGQASALNQPALVRKAVAPNLLKAAARLADEARNRRLEAARLRRLRNALPSRVLPAILKPQAGRSLAIGFYVNWAGDSGENSFAALKRDLKQLDWVLPSWLYLDGSNSDFKNTFDRRSLNYMRANKPGVAILPVIQNVTAGDWNGPGLAKLLKDTARRKALLNNIVTFLEAQKLQGVVIDFEDVPPAAHKDLEAFLTNLSQAFAPHGWIIVQAAPFDDDAWRPLGWESVTGHGMAQICQLFTFVHVMFHSMPPNRGVKQGDRFPPCKSVMLRRNWWHDHIKGNSEKNGQFPVFSPLGQGNCGLMSVAGRIGVSNGPAAETGTVRSAQRT